MILVLFNLGKVPAIFATIIYALPPPNRLTNLGIRQVDGEIKEAAFGLTPWQMLLGVEIPLARPSIMANVNQTIMVALAMVVVASMTRCSSFGRGCARGNQHLECRRGIAVGYRRGDSGDGVRRFVEKRAINLEPTASG